MFGNMIATMVKFFQAEQDQLHLVTTGWREFNDALQITDDQLKVSNDKLENQLAKLTGNPQNQLKVMLDEAALSADKLALALNKDFDEIVKLLDKANVSLTS